nr:type IV conjugative transfer system protein TraL [Zoogloeaceae bacterium]
MDANGETSIIRRLDDPWKLGLWELDVALPFAFCLMMGIVKGTALALIASVLIGWFIAARVTKIKAAKHPKYFKHILYWTLPPLVGLAPRAFPPSAQNEMVG